MNSASYFLGGLVIMLSLFGQTYGGEPYGGGLYNQNQPAPTAQPQPTTQPSTQPSTSPRSTPSQTTADPTVTDDKQDDSEATPAAPTTDRSTPNTTTTSADKLPDTGVADESGFDPFWLIIIAGAIVATIIISVFVILTRKLLHRDDMY